ncbi:MAG: alkaline shock response membrane anchor protein AmaP [Candidatus Omnitrophica bacterium]|nr:alkaline shock response membrane anchor protein AmaP [Candidatus Omnitrophota bacterium]
MRALAMFVTFICTLIFTVIGALLFSFSFDVFTLQNLTEFLRYIYQFEDINLIIGGTGLFLAIASIFTAQICLGKLQREKTIAFSNPDGEVTVSLTAIEDFVRRLSTSIVEIKDLRSNVIAGKKGIEINVRVSLWADANIPETTSAVQDIIKTRIQEILGIEDPIVVRVHVGKIVPKAERKRPKKKESDEETPPFRGSIEYGKEG